MLSELINNPTFTLALQAVSPQLAGLIPLLKGIFGVPRKKKSEIKILIEKKITSYMSECTRKDISKNKVSELEIRTHELLGLLLEIDKQ